MCVVLCTTQVTQLEVVMNKLVFIQVSILFVFSAVLAGLGQWWTANHRAPYWWYLLSLDKYPDLPPGGTGWLVEVSSHSAADAVPVALC